MGGLRKGFSGAICIVGPLNKPISEMTASLWEMGRLNELPGAGNIAQMPPARSAG